MKILRKCLIIAISILLVSCGNKQNTPSATLDIYIKDQLDGVKEKIMETMQNNDDGNFSNDQLEELGTLIIDFTYQIDNEQIKGDEASCDLTINCYDFGEMLTSFFKNYISQAFSAALSSAGHEPFDEKIEKLTKEIWEESIQETKTKGRTISKTITIYMHKTNTGWEIDEEKCQKELVDAITGGLLSAINELPDSLEGFIK